jgi:FKBP-type peptidyl-prolyl cis-trans isomerase FkpA
MRTLFFLLATLGTIGFTSCNRDKDVDQDALDQNIIQDYVHRNSLDAEEKEEGVWVEILEEASGESATLSSVVEVNYKGYLTNGDVFDESTNPIEFGLSQVIRGWQVGIPYIPAGGSGRLLIPSGKGYGDRAVGSIPANSVLIFEVDVISVTN